MRARGRGEKEAHARSVTEAHVRGKSVSGPRVKAALTSGEGRP